MENDTEGPGEIGQKLFRAKPNRECRLEACAAVVFENNIVRTKPARLVDDIAAETKPQAVD